MLKEGGDYGWPTCYFDPTQKKLVLSPEYGGDGGKKTDDCAQFEAPVSTFPAHWAPNDLKIYKAPQFPKGYQGGAFIAFHGGPSGQSPSRKEEAPALRATGASGSRR